MLALQDIEKEVFSFPKNKYFLVFAMTVYYGFYIINDFLFFLFFLLIQPWLVLNKTILRLSHFFPMRFKFVEHCLICFLFHNYFYKIICWNLNSKRGEGGRVRFVRSTRQTNKK